MLRLGQGKAALKALAFSPDGGLLAAGGHRGVLQLWDLSSARLRFRLGYTTEAVSRVAFTPDGRHLIAAAAGVWFWDLADETASTHCLLDALMTPSAALAPDGRLLCLGYYDAAAAGRFAAITFPQGERRWDRLLGPLPMPGPMAFTPDGRRFLAGHYPRGVLAYDAATGEAPAEVARTGGILNDLAVSPDGRSLVCAAATHLQLFRLDPAAEVAHHRLGRTHFLGVAFHPSGGFFASCNGDGKVDYWDARTGEHLRALDWQIGKLHGVAFDAAGDRAACCSKTGYIVIWDVDR